MPSAGKEKAVSRGSRRRQRLFHNFKALPCIEESIEEKEWIPARKPLTPAAAAQRNSVAIGGGGSVGAGNAVPKRDPNAPLLEASVEDIWDTWDGPAAGSNSLPMSNVQVFVGGKQVETEHFNKEALADMEDLQESLKRIHRAGDKLLSMGLSPLPTSSHVAAGAEPEQHCVNRLRLKINPVMGPASQPAVIKPPTLPRATTARKIMQPWLDEPDQCQGPSPTKMHDIEFLLNDEWKQHKEVNLDGIDYIVDCYEPDAKAAGDLSGSKQPEKQPPKPRQAKTEPAIQLPVAVRSQAEFSPDGGPHPFRNAERKLQPAPLKPCASRPVSPCQGKPPQRVFRLKGEVERLNRRLARLAADPRREKYVQVVHQEFPTKTMLDAARSTRPPALPSHRPTEKHARALIARDEQRNLKGTSMEKTILQSHWKRCRKPRKPIPSPTLTTRVWLDGKPQQSIWLEH
eukprot:scpid67255/ scgid26671/ 